MSLVDSLRAFFGKGRFRVEGVTICGRPFTLKGDYLGVPTHADLLEMARENLLVEHGLRAASMRVVGITEE
jgi:hypothetical protein